MTASGGHSHGVLLNVPGCCWLSSPSPQCRNRSPGMCAVMTATRSSTFAAAAWTPTAMYAPGATCSSSTLNASSVNLRSGEISGFPNVRSNARGAEPRPDRRGFKSRPSRGFPVEASRRGPAAAGAGRARITARAAGTAPTADPWTTAEAIATVSGTCRAARSGETARGLGLPRTVGFLLCLNRRRSFHVFSTQCRTVSKQRALS